MRGDAYGFGKTLQPLQDRLSQPWRNAVLSCLSPNPSDRPVDAFAIHAAMDGPAAPVDVPESPVTEEESTASKKANPEPASAIWRRPEALRFAAIAGAFALLLIFASAFLTGEKTTSAENDDGESELGFDENDWLLPKELLAENGADAFLQPEEIAALPPISDTELGQNDPAPVSPVEVDPGQIVAVSPPVATTDSDPSATAPSPTGGAQIVATLPPSPADVAPTESQQGLRPERLIRKLPRNLIRSKVALPHPPPYPTIRNLRTQHDPPLTGHLWRPKHPRPNVSGADLSHIRSTSRIALPSTLTVSNDQETPDPARPSTDRPSVATQAPPAERQAPLILPSPIRLPHRPNPHRAASGCSALTLRRNYGTVAAPR